MPNLAAIFGVAAALVWDAAALAEEPNASPRTPAAEFEVISSDVRQLWAGDECFRSPNSLALTRTRDCWALAAERLVTAQAASYQLIDRLEAIKGIYPARALIVQTQMNLMSRASLFCEVASISVEDLRFIEAQPVNFREWVSALDVCARATTDAEMYERLRGAIARNIRRYSKSHRVALLQIWYDSFLYQYDPRGDLSKVAVSINQDNVKSWKLFVSFLNANVASFPNFPTNIVSSSELLAAKRVLYSA